MTTRWRHATRLQVWVPVAIVALLLVGFLVIPLARITWGSLGGTAFDPASYRAIFQEPLYFRVILRTFQIGAWVTLGCILLGYPVAYLLANSGRFAATILTTLLLVPLFTAFLIRTYAWMILLGRAGIINKALLDIGLISQPLDILHNTPAVYIGMVHVLMPIAIFTMYAVMAQFDRTLGTAASILGADPVRSFFRVFLPLSMPGVLAGTVLVFVMAIGFYITPALLGGTADTMISQLIVTQVSDLFDFQTGFALSIVILIATAAVLYLANLIVPLEILWSPQSAASATERRRRTRQGRLTGVRSAFPRVGFAIETISAALLGSRPRLRRWLLWGFAIVIVFYLVAPLIVILILSFSSSPFLVFPPPGFSLRWYEAFLSAPEWRNALFFSLRLGAVAALIAVVAGTAGAYLFVRRRIPAKRALFLFMISPMVIPIIVLALALYREMLDLGLLGTFWAIAIGHAVISTPFVVVVMTSALQGFDRALEQAASILGARPLYILRRVTLPILRPALLTGALLAFLTSFDELLIALFLLGRQPPTLPIKMWADIRMQLNPVISAASSTIVVGIIVVITVGQWLRTRIERRRGQIPTR